MPCLDLDNEALKKPLSRAKGAESADALQGERKPDAAFLACTDVELVEFHASSVTVAIIANLRNCVLEQPPLNIVGKRERGNEAGAFTVSNRASGLMAGGLESRGARKEVGHSGRKPAFIDVSGQTG